MSNRLLPEEKDLVDLLENPTTLRIFLYMRLQSGYVGIRQTQRDLEIKSPSTVSWHLDKLTDSGYIEKSDANQYQLSAKGRLVSQIQIPVNVSFKLISQRLVSSKVIQIAMLVFSILVGFVLAFNNLLWAVVYLMSVLIMVTILIIKEHLTIMRSLSNVLDNAKFE